MRCPVTDGRVAEHGLPDPETERALLAHLDATATKQYGTIGYVIDRTQRQIPDHWHAHARPAG